MSFKKLSKESSLYNKEKVYNELMTYVESTENKIKEAQKQIQLINDAILEMVEEKRCNQEKYDEIGEKFDPLQKITDVLQQFTENIERATSSFDFSIKPSKLLQSSNNPLGVGTANICGAKTDKNKEEDNQKDERILCLQEQLRDVMQKMQELCKENCKLKDIMDQLCPPPPCPPPPSCCTPKKTETREDRIAEKLKNFENTNKKLQAQVDMMECKLKRLKADAERAHQQQEQENRGPI